MATVTYPTDATLSALSFASTADVSYTANGIRTAFNLGESVNFKGETIAQFDGVIQDSSQYTMSNSFNTVNFASAPSSGLTVKLTSITLPERFITIRSFPRTLVQSYGLAATSVDSNNYSINGKIILKQAPKYFSDLFSFSFRDPEKLSIIFFAIDNPNPECLS